MAKQNERQKKLKELLGHPCWPATIFASTGLATSDVTEFTATHKFCLQKLLQNRDTGEEFSCSQREQDNLLNAYKKPSGILAKASFKSVIDAISGPTLLQINAEIIDSRKRANKLTEAYVRDSEKRDQSDKNNDKPDQEDSSEEERTTGNEEKSKNETITVDQTGSNQNGNIIEANMNEIGGDTTDLQNFTDRSNLLLTSGNVLHQSTPITQNPNNQKHQAKLPNISEETITDKTDPKMDQLIAMFGKMQEATSKVERWAQGQHGVMQKFEEKIMSSETKMESFMHNQNEWRKRQDEKLDEKLKNLERKLERKISQDHSDPNEMIENASNDQSNQRYDVNRTWNPSSNKSLGGLLIEETRYETKTCGKNSVEFSKQIFQSCKAESKINSKQAILAKMLESVEIYDRATHGSVFSFLTKNFKSFVEKYPTVPLFALATLTPFLFEEERREKVERIVNRVLEPYFETEKELFRLNKKLTDGAFESDMLNIDGRVMTIGKRITTVKVTRFRSWSFRGELFFELSRILSPNDPIEYNAINWSARGSSDLTELFKRLLFQEKLKRREETAEQITDKINLSLLKKCFSSMVAFLEKDKSEEANSMLREIKNDKTTFAFQYAPVGSFKLTATKIDRIHEELLNIFNKCQWSTAQQKISNPEIKKSSFLVKNCEPSDLSSDDEELVKIYVASENRS